MAKAEPARTTTDRLTWLSIPRQLGKMTVGGVAKGNTRDGSAGSMTLSLHKVVPKFVKTDLAGYLREWGPKMGLAAIRQWPGAE